MNVYQPDETVRARWPEWEWRGRRWTKHGLTWIRARHKVMGWQWYYCFERDCFIFRPEPGAPPPYTAAVRLMSTEPVSARRGDWSYLYVAWFLETPQGTLLDMVHPVVCGIDWDCHARDASLD